MVRMTGSPDPAGVSPAGGGTHGLRLPRWGGAAALRHDAAVPRHPSRPGPPRAGRRTHGRRLRARQRRGRRLPGHQRAGRDEPRDRHRHLVPGLRRRWSRSRATWRARCSERTAFRKPTSPGSRSRSRSTTTSSCAQRTSRWPCARPSTSPARDAPGRCTSTSPRTSFQEEAEFEWPEEIRLRGYKPTIEGHAGMIRRAAEAINKAERPIIISGHGIVWGDAHAELLTLAEKAQIPVITTFLGIGGFPETASAELRLPRDARHVSRQHGRRQSRRRHRRGHALRRPRDGALQRLQSGRDDRPHRHRPRRDWEEPADGDPRRRPCQARPPRAHEPSRGTHARSLGSAGSTRCGRSTRASRSARPGASSPSTSCAPCTRRRRGRRRSSPAWASTRCGRAQHYFYDNPRQLISSGGLGTMGFELPGAIGAQAAKPDAEVWAICGDAGFQMTLHELAVCVGRTPAGEDRES